MTPIWPVAGLAVVGLNAQSPMARIGLTVHSLQVALVFAMTLSLSWPMTPTGKRQS
jgi:hypothetical protein